MPANKASNDPSPANAAKVATKLEFRFGRLTAARSAMGVSDPSKLLPSFLGNKNPRARYTTPTIPSDQAMALGTDLVESATSWANVATLAYPAKAKKTMAAALGIFRSEPVGNA